jgi:cell division protein FtsZ
MQPIAPNVTSLRKVTADAGRGSDSFSGNGGSYRPAEVSSGGMNAFAASGFGAAIPDTGLTGQPMMSSGGEDTSGARQETGRTDSYATDSNLALDREPDLLSDIEDTMEESDTRSQQPDGREAPFKAPPVIRVEKEPESLINPAARESAEENSGPARKRKGPSLFERMTGVGRVARKADAERQASQRHEPFAGMSSPAAQESEPKPRQEALSPSVRIEQKTEDEDLLDIPAFLRRQAN